MSVMHYDEAYSISPKAQAILDRKRRQFVCDSSDDLQDMSERVSDLEQHRRDHEERMNGMTVGLGEARADITDLRKSRDNHEKILNSLSEDEEPGLGQTPEANMQDAVGGQNTYGPNKQVSGYQITSDLRAINNRNRRKWNLDEITDGPTAPNNTGKTDSISGNSSKTQKSVDLGKVYNGSNTSDASVFAALAPEYYRRQQQETSSSIRDLQARLNKVWERK